MSWFHLPAVVLTARPSHHPTRPQRGLQQLQNSLGSRGQNGPDKPRAYSLMVQGLRTNPSDPDAHVLFFDIESLIGEPVGRVWMRGADRDWHGGRLGWGMRRSAGGG